jgi:hypothetical protein
MEVEEVVQVNWKNKGEPRGSPLFFQFTLCHVRAQFL